MKLIVFDDEKYSVVKATFLNRLDLFQVLAIGHPDKVIKLFQER